VSLRIDVEKRLGDFALAARLVAGPGLTALFGASGSGKTSLVDLIAGLARPDRGRIAVDGHILVDTEAGRFVPPHRRRLGYVFQDARLFPHLSVRRNLLYGHLFTPRAERRERLDRVAELLGIGTLLDRRPGALSGGEKSRVAIGRALLASPRLLLMDEPLASLDEPRKAEILPWIERLRDEAGVPIVYVSHSVAEVARLATTVAILERGRVVATGPAAELLGRPDLLPEGERREAGTLLEMTVAGPDAPGLTRLEGAAGTLRVPVLASPPGTRLRLLVRAREVMVATERPRGLSALNILPGTVASVTPDGGAALVRIACGQTAILARITAHSAAALGLAPGRPVHAVVKSVAIEDGTRAPQPVET
jgi:molybdate transport system ATP-binding protein